MILNTNESMKKFNELDKLRSVRLSFRNEIFQLSKIVIPQQPRPSHLLQEPEI